MAIPLDPSLVGNARTVSAQFNAISMNLCKMPVNGIKCVSLQYSYVISKGIPLFFDLGNASLNSGLDQLCAMFVDATKMDADLYITFSDTGYSVKILAGTSLFFPVITGTSLPKFYVSTPGYEHINIDGIINLFLFNQFIPSFNTSYIQQILSGGLDVYNITKIQESIQSQNYSGFFDLTVAAQGASIIPPFRGRPSLVGMQLYLVGLATVATQLNLISVYDGWQDTGGGPIFKDLIQQIPIILTNTLQIIKICDTQFDNVLSGLSSQTIFNAAVSYEILFSIDSLINVSTARLYYNYQIGNLSQLTVV